MVSLSKGYTKLSIFYKFNDHVKLTDDMLYVSFDGRPGLDLICIYL